MKTPKNIVSTSNPRLLNVANASSISRIIGGIKKKIATGAVLQVKRKKKTIIASEI